MENYLKAIKKNWLIIVIVVILITAFSFGVSIFQTPKYKASVKLLVIQKLGTRLDAFTAARSAQTVGEILSRMVYTSSFFDQVMTSGFRITDDFPKDAEKRKKEWKERIVARVIDEAGTVQVDVYHKNPDQARETAFGIAYVMINSGRQFHGGGEQIEIKMVDLPVISAKPVKPNVLQNTLGGFVLSLLVSVSLIILLAGAKKEE